MRYVPNIQIPSLNDCIHRVNDYTVTYSPVELEKDGRLLFFRIRRYNGLIERVADRIPDGLWNRWMALANTNFIICMTVALSAFLALVSLIFVGFIDVSITTLLNLDLSGSSSGMPPLTVEYALEKAREIVDILFAIGAFLVAAVMAAVPTYIMYHLVMLIFVPGLVLHELGHAIAVLKHGGEIESTGLIFIGPFVMGAFVEPADGSTRKFTFSQEQDVYAAGIIHNISLAVAFATAGILVENQFVSTTLFLLATFEAASSVLNAFPYSKLDGGHYAESVAASWFVPATIGGASSE